MSEDRTHLEELERDLRGRVPVDAVHRLRAEPDETVAALLEIMHVPQTLDILERLPPGRRKQIEAAASDEKREQWSRNLAFKRGRIGRMMELPAAVFPPEMTVAEAVEHLREAVKRRFITYCYITDPEGKLIGLVVMRDMLLASGEQTLGDIMLEDPFFLSPKMPVADAMKEAAARHFPVYPVCEEDGTLLGLVRGDDLFEQNVFQLVVQAGSMVGVEKEERVTTAWTRSFRLRHPWLLLNLVTAAVAGAVVGLFESTIDQLVVLAAFLPVLAGQSGNTGCQALAVTLRGMTLGDLSKRRPAAIVTKEAIVGLLNGAIIGAIAGIGMLYYARSQGNENAVKLAFVVMAAMTGSCVASGVTGALVPMGLKKVGADPATASSIFLTTATDVVSMGLLLGLARWLIL